MSDEIPPPSKPRENNGRGAVDERTTFIQNKSLETRPTGPGLFAVKPEAKLAKTQLPWPRPCRYAQRVPYDPQQTSWRIS